MTTHTLDETSFPLYAISSINADLFVTAGGGGSAKTGVKNAIRVYKLIPQGKLFTATNVCEVSCGSRAPMNLHVNTDRDVLATGMDHLCKLYTLKNTNKDKILLDEKSSVESVPSSTEDEDGDYQKCVCFTPDNKHLITAASNGSCKAYKYPSLEVVFTIKKAHSEEIDDMDVHPNSKYFVTVSKECSAALWKIADGRKELELPFSLAKKDEDLYRFRNCRFSENLDNKKVYLFTTHNPLKNAKANPNCLVRWNTMKWIPEQVVQLKQQTLSALAVSSGGRYVGMGTADGSVIVYISWNLRHLRTVKGVHDIFVTGLSFLPDSKVLCEDLKQDAALLSCSIDNKCQVTLVPRRSEFSITMVIIMFAFIIFALFNMITYFDADF